MPFLNLMALILSKCILTIVTNLEHKLGRSASKVSFPGSNASLTLGSGMKKPDLGWKKRIRDGKNGSGVNFRDLIFWSLVTIFGLNT
jgi:hypothetical protein